MAAEEASPPAPYTYYIHRVAPDGKSITTRAHVLPAPPEGEKTPIETPRETIWQRLWTLLNKEL